MEGIALDMSGNETTYRYANFPLSEQFVTVDYRFLLLAALAAIPAASHAERRYGVDDMLALESIGSARFGPSGETLLFERLGPFEKQSDFGRPYVIGQHRSRIYRVDLQEREAPRLLFDQDPGEGYALRSISPDGAYVNWLNVSSNGLTPGIASLDGREVRRFDIAPGYMTHIDRPWLGGRLLPYEALPPGEVAMAAGLGREQMDALVERWRLRTAGTAPTAIRIGSGRFRAIPESDHTLVLVDALTGSSETVTGGEFAGLFASADGTLLAALREAPLDIDPDRLLEHGANIGGVQHELLMVDTGGDGPASPTPVCAGCDVLVSSLNWAAEAPLLSFYARDENTDWADARYRVYDHRGGTTRAVALDGIAPHVGRAGSVFMDVRSAWLGERLAVFASAVTENGTAHKERGDWYVLGESTPRNLTAGFSGESPLLIALSGKSLILLHDGDAWRVDADGRRRNLTGSVPEEVTEWRTPSPYGGLARYNLQPSDTVILQIESADEGPDRLLFVDPWTGDIDTVTAPSSKSEFIAVSAEKRRVALLEKAGNETVLMVADAGGSRRELARLNGHLADVVGGKPVRIDHRGPAGDDRVSWMLLPPGYEEGNPMATVVKVYPGASCRETYSKWQLDDMHALNDHILAARGYAVLYPCIPVAYHEVPRDPLDGLVEQVDAAVDAAVERGYADPDRLAVQGQSYGGYATGALIGLTDRFKSAVAQAGIYNLVSSYGQFDIRQRLVHERTGLDLFAVSLMETSQGGMGAPPWEDPERYLRNSPLMHVENVTTPVLLFSGDRDYVSTTQTEEFFTALTRLNRDAVLVRYFGEGHVFNSPANIRDMWRRIFDWYGETLDQPAVSSAD